MSPNFFGFAEGWSWRFLERSSFWWAMAHFYLSAVSVGGLVLVFLGGRAFRWESSVSVSNGARWVRLGAGFSLCFLMVQSIVLGGWCFFRGSGFVEDMLAYGGSSFVMFLIIGAVCLVMLFELLLRVLRRGGSVRLSGSFAIFLLFILAVSVNSARLTLSQNGFSLFQPSVSAGQTLDRSR